MILPIYLLYCKNKVAMFYKRRIDESYCSTLNTFIVSSINQYVQIIDTRVLERKFFY